MCLPISISKLIICCKVKCSRVVSFSLHSLSSFSIWGQLMVDLLVSSSSNQCQHHDTLKSLVPSWSIGVGHFQLYMAVSGEIHFSSSGLVPLVLSIFLVEHVIGWFRLLILIIPCYMKALWLPTVLNLLKDIHHWFLMVKYLFRNISVDQVPRGLPLLYLSLWLLKVMCCIDKGSLPQSVRQWLEHLQQRPSGNVGKHQQVGVLERVYQTMPFLYLIFQYCFFIYRRLNMAWHNDGIYHFINLTFLLSQGFKWFYHCSVTDINVWILGMEFYVDGAIVKMTHAISDIISITSTIDVI